MSSSALSSRRTYLRRPKVCKSLPNPGRCQPTPPGDPPTPCPPAVLTGFFDFRGIPDCHGEDHRRNFIALRDPDVEDPWQYASENPPFPNTDGVFFALAGPPSPSLFINTWYIGYAPAHCAYAIRLNLPIVWCIHQYHVVETWDDITDGLSCRLYVSW